MLVPVIARNLNKPTTPLYPGGKAGTRQTFLLLCFRALPMTGQPPPCCHGGQELAVIVPLPRTVSPS